MITNNEALQLIQMLKKLQEKGETIYFPISGEELKLPADSLNRKQHFSFVVNRKINHPDAPKTKVTFITLYKNTALMRIDTAGTPHINQQGAIDKHPELELQRIVPTPHIHVYDEEYNIAYQLKKYIKCDIIETVNDLIDIFIAFLVKSNVVNIKEYSIQKSM